MDLTLSGDQTAIVELAARILGDRSTPEALAAAEAGGGYGILEATLLCQEVGRAAAAVPLWATLCLGALPLARHGSPAPRRELLGRVADGSLILTAAVVEEGSALPPTVPATTAAPTAEGWALRGTKRVVPSAHLSDAGVEVRVLVPAATGGEASTMFVVDPAAPGVSLERQVGTDLEPLATLTFAGAAVGSDAVVGAVGGGAEVTTTIVAMGTAGICARQAGTCEPPRARRRPTPPNGSSPAPRSPPSRPWPTAWPTPTSTPRPSASPPSTPRG